jgi:hypothetical protein
MPNFIKGLGDIKEGCGAVVFVLKGFIGLCDVFVQWWSVSA